MSDRRRKLAELKQKKALAAQLNKANAVKLLQQKKLQNLRKQNSAKNNGGGGGSNLGLTALASPQTQSAVTRLSPNEKLQMLSWLDLERNSEILSKTDKKIKEKMKARLTADKLVQKAARYHSQIIMLQNDTFILNFIVCALEIEKEVFVL